VGVAVFVGGTVGVTVGKGVDVGGGVVEVGSGVAEAMACRGGVEVE